MALISDKQIDYLKQCLAKGSGLLVYWDDGDGLRPISSIVPSITGFKQDDNNEPGPCAILARGGHIALDNISDNEIMVVRDVTTWPDDVPSMPGAVTIGEITIVGTKTKTPPCHPNSHRYPTKCPHCKSDLTAYDGVMVEIKPVDDDDDCDGFAGRLDAQGWLLDSEDGGDPITGGRHVSTQCSNCDRPLDQYEIKE